MIRVMVVGLLMVAGAVVSKEPSHGTRTFTNEKVSEVVVNGFVTLKGSKVTKRLQVNGRVEAEGCSIARMEINGSADLSDCVIKGRGSVNGVLVANDSNFDDKLTVTSEKMTFNNCTLKALYIPLMTGCKEPQIVELLGKTQVSGTITFASGKGEVIAGPGSELNGAVIGGSVRKNLVE